jgi:hypothetical protein
MTKRMSLPKVDAHIYLDDNGSECSRADFVNTENYFYGHNLADQKPYLFYVGAGFVRLKVAVWGWNEGDAWSAVQEHLQNTRPDELDENGDIEELLIFELQEK